MPNVRQGEKPDRKAIEKLKSELKKLEKRHKQIQTELNLAVKVVQQLKATVRTFYGPTCK